MNIKENVSLKDFSSFKIGGNAKYFFIAKSKEDVVRAFEFSELKKIQVFILGEGSNTLIGDKGFNGLVLKINIKGIEWNNLKNETSVIVGAGENWDNLVKLSVEKNLFGLENLSSIPGSVGAAPVQNIGAYGAEIKDVLNWVEVFDTKNKTFKIISKEKCKFGYRDSIFKKAVGKKFVITRVSLTLKNKGVLNLDYKDIKEYFNLKNVKKPTIKELREAVVGIRKRKFPDLKVHGTAGSFFKNPIVSKKKFEELKKKYPEIPSYNISDNKIKIPLAWVIDKICNLKGYREGNVGVFSKQAIVLVNYGGATSKEVEKVYQKIKKTVKQKTGINIEMEVRKM